MNITTNRQGHMKRFLKRLADVAIGAMLTVSFAQHASAISFPDRLASYDGVYYVTQYPNGDKPQGGGTTPPAGWTALSLGDGFGTWTDLSGSYFFNGGGSDTVDDTQNIYKSGGAGEVQIEGRVLNDYAGSAQAFAGLGGGLRDSTSQSSFVAQCKALQTHTHAIQCQTGIPGSTTQYNCAATAGLNRPIWWTVTYYPANTEIKGFTSTATTPSGPSDWSECFTLVRSMSTPLAFFLGGSKSPSIALTGTISGPALKTEIDAYAETPIGGSAPTVDTAIPDQSGVQGAALAFTNPAGGATPNCVTTNFGSETGFNAVSGLAVGTGITFNTGTGCFSGTYNANDVGTRNVTVTATNASGSTPDTFSLQVSASSGDLFILPVTASAANYRCAIAATGCNGASWTSCRSTGSGTSPGPGDTMRLEGGNHGLVTFTDCNGSASADLNITNDPTYTGQTVVQKTSGTDGPLFLFQGSNTYLTISGRGKWSGAPGGRCGVSEDGTWTLGRNNCGLKITRTSPGHPQDYIGLKNYWSDITFEDIEIDGVDAHSGSCDAGGGHGIVNNDHSDPYLWQPPYDVYKNNFLMTHTYVHNTGSCGSSTGEGAYLGGNSKNGTQEDIPIKNQEFSYNIFEDIGGGAVKYKEVFGVNSIHDNYMHDIGGFGATKQVDIIQWKNVSNLSIYRNWAFDTLGQCIAGSGEDPLPHVPSLNLGYLRIWGNMVSDCGTGDATFNRNGIKAANGNMRYEIAIEVDFNTAITTPGAAISLGTFLTGSATPQIRGNLALDYGTSEASAIVGGTETNNKTSGITINDTNFISVSGKNYRIRAVNAARNPAGGNNGGCPATDLDGDTRPKETVCDQGADEYAP